VENCYLTIEERGILLSKKRGGASGALTIKERGVLAARKRRYIYNTQTLNTATRRAYSSLPTYNDREHNSSALLF
jgi:hypothetical protein